MPRKNRNARKSYYDRSKTFRKLCRELGISPKQRIQIVRYLKKVGET